MRSTFLKAFLVLAVILGGAFFCAQDVSAANMLADPNFTNQINAWDIVEPDLDLTPPVPDPTWIADDVTPIEGTYSPKNTINTADLNTTAASYYATVSQTFNATVNTDYYATLQAQTVIDATSHVQAGLLIQFLDNSPTPVVLLEVKDTIGGNTPQRSLYVTAKAPPGTYYIRYNCLVYTNKADTAAQGGMAWFDQAVLDTDFIAPPSSTWGLLNADFTNGLSDWDVTEPDLVEDLDIGPDVTPPLPTWEAQGSQLISAPYGAENIINMTDLKTTATSYYATSSQTLSATPGTPYYATLQAQTAISPLARAKAGLLIEFLDHDGNSLDQNGNIITDPSSITTKDMIGGNTPWRYLYVAATAPSNTEYIRYGCMISTDIADTVAQGGLVYFDDATLSTIDPGAPAASLVLLNPDFTNGLNDWDVTEPDLTAQVNTWEAQGSLATTPPYAAKQTIDMTDLSSSATSYYAACSQEFPITAGTPVYATVWAITDFNTISGAKAGLKLVFYDDSGAIVSSTQQQIGGQNLSWYPLTLSGVVAPTATLPAVTAKLKYILYVYANKTDSYANGGTAYFDGADLDFTYIQHLGYTGGLDQFPQETVQLPYYTGAASTVMTLRYLLGTSPAQAAIYNTYHVGAGTDMNSAEITYAVNQEIPSTYNYTDWYQTPSQIDAIKNFVYWIDYVPAGGLRCPAFVPINGVNEWRLVRGIATDVQPHPIGQPMPNFNVLGLWINDPSVSGLGYNIYQEPTDFQVDYLPIAGQYRAVYEPPINLNRVVFYKQLQKAKVSLVPAQPNADLKKEVLKLSKQGVAISLGSQPLANTMFSALKSLSVPAIFSKKYLEAALPKALKRDTVFMSLFNKSTTIRQFEVYNKNTQKNYILLALDSADPIGKSYTLPATLTSGLLKTRILIEVNPATGAVVEATWDKKGEIYPKVVKDQAIQVAQNYLSGQSGYAKNIKPQAKSVRLVWARSLKVSRFLPVWEIVFTNNQTVIVKQNKTCSVW